LLCQHIRTQIYFACAAFLGISLHHDVREVRFNVLRQVSVPTIEQARSRRNAERTTHSLQQDVNNCA